MGCGRGVVIDGNRKMEAIPVGVKQVHGFDVDAGVGQPLGHLGQGVGIVLDHSLDYALLLEPNTGVGEDATGDIHVVGHESSHAVFAMREQSEGFDMNSGGCELADQSRKLPRPIRQVDRELSHTHSLRLKGTKRQSICGFWVNYPSR